MRKMANEKRLIDAKALLRRLQKRREDFASGWRTFDSMPDGAKVKYEENLGCSLIIEDFPTVDAVEAVHGKWEYGRWENGHWVKGNERCRCSVCHRDFAVDNLNIWNGCPHCLAKMDGEPCNNL